MINFIRKLARSTYWQNIYNASKECSGIHLFKNKYNFSYAQERFLYWLSVYDSLYTDLQRCEDDLLTLHVINDDDRCDAYLYCRGKKRENEWKKYRQEKFKNEKVRNKNKKNLSTYNVDFRRE